jgi:transcriptional regulator with XRE-family HTH domain
LTLDLLWTYYGRMKEGLPRNLLITRRSFGLSQRDLAARSGVAHDTIGQIERGQRAARPSTVRKLAEAIGVPPELLLAGSKQEFWDTLRKWHDEQVRHEEQQRESEAKSKYAALLEDITLAQKKLASDDLVEIAHATLLITRVSAELTNVIASELAAHSNKSRGRANLTHPNFAFGAEEIPHLAGLGRAMADCWLDGAAATKRLLDLQRRATDDLGELSLEPATAAVEGRKVGWDLEQDEHDEDR